jgi:cobalt-zinc-cadmium resistance protein CzcA
VPGVADVNALGGKVRSFEWCPTRCAWRPGLSTAAEAAIDANNRNDGAGRLGEGDEVLLVRSEGSIRTRTTCGHRRQVRGPAACACGRGRSARRQRDPLRRGDQDGKGEAVQGLVLGLAGANAQKVEGVTRKIEEIKPTLPKGMNSRCSTTARSWWRRPWARCPSALMEATVLVLVLLGPSSATSGPRSRWRWCCRCPLATFMLMRWSACRPT